MILRDRFDVAGSGGERLYALPNRQGSIAALVDTSDLDVAGLAVDSRFEYDAYGTPKRTGTDFAWNVLFGGYYFDRETGLYHVRHRFYHPGLGRWLQHDPLGNVDSHNLYEYCDSSPANYVDPMGSYFESLWDLGSLALGIWSFRHNIREGNLGWAAIDAIGIVADAAALLLPVVPGGAGVAIKAMRAGGMAIDATNTARRIGRIERGVDFASDTVKFLDLGGECGAVVSSLPRGRLFRRSFSECWHGS